MTQERSHEVPRPPDSMTEPCARFVHDHAELINFILYITHLATRADEAAKTQATALFATASDSERQELERLMEQGVGALARLMDYRQLVLQMMLCRAVDNYLTYVSEIMALIFRTRPETLTSRETIRVDELLQHETMDDVVAMLTERRVDRLAYMGMRDLSAYLCDRLDFTLFEKDDDLKKAVWIVGVRNVIVHNRAVINRRFLSGVPDSQGKLGEKVELFIEEVLDAVDFLGQCCAETDRRAASKFDLPRPISIEQFSIDQLAT